VQAEPGADATDAEPTDVGHILPIATIIMRLKALKTSGPTRHRSVLETDEIERADVGRFLGWGQSALKGIIEGVIQVRPAQQRQLSNVLNLMDRGLLVKVRIEARDGARWGAKWNTKQWELKRLPSSSPEDSKRPSVSIMSDGPKIRWPTGVRF